MRREQGLRFNVKDGRKYSHQAEGRCCVFGAPRTGPSSHLLPGKGSFLPLLPPPPPMLRGKVRHHFSAPALVATADLSAPRHCRSGLLVRGPWPEERAQRECGAMARVPLLPRNVALSWRWISDATIPVLLQNFCRILCM